MMQVVSRIKQQARAARHKRVRAKVFGTAERPRLTVYKSNTGVYLQMIDDEAGRTLISVNDRGLAGKNKTERAQTAGTKMAELATKKNIKQVVFDRAGFKYHGRIAAVAKSSREGGLKF